MPRILLSSLLALGLAWSPISRAQASAPELESRAAAAPAPSLGSAISTAAPASAVDLRAAAASSSLGQVHRLRFDWALTGSLAGAGGAAWGVTEILKPAIAPMDCVWCDRDETGASTLEGLDLWGREARWAAEQQDLAARLSDVTVYLAVPGFVLGMDAFMASRQGGWGLFAEDALIIVEAAAMAMVLNQGLKFVFGRERPFVAALPASERPLTAHPADNNLSFYSGHASFAFSLAVAAGTVAELRGYEHRAWVWAVGLPLAALAPYFRMASDRHYLTDVSVGMLSGAAFGVLVPLLLHGRVEQSALAGQLRVVPSGDGLAVVGTF